MHKRITIQNLSKIGQKKQLIAKEFGCHRNTVRNIEKENPIKEKVNRSAKKHPLNEHRDFIESLLEKKLTIKRIYEELVEKKNYTKKYDNVKKYIRTQKLKAKNKVYIVLHSEPGEEGQVDFGYVGLTKDNEGKMRKTWVFVMTLSHSRKAFYKIVYNQTVEEFIRCHKEAFEYFGGVPENVKIDNLKAAILEASFYEPEYQKEYLEFSEYYRFKIVPCKVRRPEEKGKVESGVKYVKESFFKGRDFLNKDDLDKKLFEWQENVCNKRIHGTTKKVPQVVFENAEKAKLIQLPKKPWETCSWEKRKVNTICHITVKNNYYSVPYKQVGEYVYVRVGEKLIKIYANNKCIATHLRIYTKGKYQTNESHYPKYKVMNQTELQHKKGKKMKEIGEHAYNYFLKLMEKFPNNWSNKVSGIINLEKSYEPSAINLACKRASKYKHYGYKVISNICKKKLYLEESDYTEKLGVILNNFDNNKIKKHEGKLARPLSYYSQIFIT